MNISKLKNLVILLALCLGCAYATEINKSGSVLLHNFNYTHNWDFGSTGLAIATGDTCYLYDDSATALPFSVAGLRIKSISEATPVEIPDSLCVTFIGAGDGTDSVYIRVQVEYSLRSGVWVQSGANSDFGLAASTVKHLFQISRKIIPGAKYRLKVAIEGATDAATLFNIRVHARG